MSIVATKLQTSDTDQLRIVESLTFKSNLAFLAKGDALVDCIEGDKSSTCSVVWSAGAAAGLFLDSGKGVGAVGVLELVDTVGGAGGKKLLLRAKLISAWVCWMSIMLGNPGGSPAGSDGPLLVFGSPMRPAAPRKGNGLGKPNKECTFVATEVGAGGGGAMEVLKGWNGEDSGVELERPFLVGVK